jgi:Uma2 family endonuclease
MSTAADSWPRRHLINVEQYYLMAEVGLLAPDARVELIEGEIIDMAPIGSKHAGVVNFLMRTLDRSLGEQGIVTVQQPLRLGHRSEPQPDLMLLRPRADFYQQSHPVAADVLLLIEVSDTTLQFDRGEKAALYARHAIQELWVVDLANRQLHCMHEPDGESYRQVISLSTPATVSVAVLPQVQLQLATLFV